LGDDGDPQALLSGRRRAYRARQLRVLVRSRDRVRRGRWRHRPHAAERARLRVPLRHEPRLRQSVEPTGADACTPEDTLAEKLEKLARSLTLARLDLSEAVPLVADFLGLTVSDGYPRLALHPDVRRRKTMELLVDWNLAIAEGQPLVMLVEDLHWVDS